MSDFLETVAAQRDRSARPFLAITHPGHVEDVMCEMRRKLLERGVASFTSFQAAARALSKAIKYWGSQTAE